MSNFTTIVLSKAHAFQIDNPRELYKFIRMHLKASERTSSRMAIMSMKKRFRKDGFARRVATNPNSDMEKEQLQEEDDPQDIVQQMNPEDYFRAQCFANYLHEMNNYKTMISMYRMSSNTSVTDQMRRMSQENFVNRLKKGSFKNIAHELSEEQKSSGEETVRQQLYKKEMDELKKNMESDLEIGNKDKL